MALCAIALAFGSVKLDEYVRGSVEAKLGWIYAGGPEGARAVLATIAGSVITVAGTTFSITIAAFSLASSQFGPRLLRTFRRDTGNQIVLGTFIATFLYCLLVLRTVRGTEKDTYVPHLSVTLGVVLACLSLAVLIFFIHHAAASIQVSRLIDSVGRELETIIHKFPACGSLGELHSNDLAFSEQQKRSTSLHSIPARQGGYLLHVDYESLGGIAAKHNCLLRIPVKPGDFIVAEMPLVMVEAESLSERRGREIQSALYMGSERTPEQDLEFGFLQLTEIAVRALSPGINDPFTAISCLDRISAALCLLSSKELPRPYYRDQEGQLRVIAQVVTYKEVVQAAFSAIRHAAKENGDVLQHLSDRITFVLSYAGCEEFRHALVSERELALKDAEILPL